MKHPLKGNTMNNTDSIAALTDAERAAVDEWCANVRAMHNVYGRPINDGDPRLEELRDMAGYSDRLTYAERGELYWWRSGIELPVWPIAAPSWMESVLYTRHNYPEMTIDMSGRDWLNESGIDGTCRIGQIVTVFIEDSSDPRVDESYPAGTVLTAPPTIYARFEEEVTAEQAVALGEALVNAGRELAAAE